MATHLVVGTSEIDLVTFPQVNEVKANVEYSLNGDKFRISWDGDEPSFVDNLTTKEGPYDEEGILFVLDSYEWLVRI